MNMKINTELLKVIIAIVAALTQVLNYFFGSSQSSAKKDEAIVSMANSIPEAPKTN